MLLRPRALCVVGALALFTSLVASATARNLDLDRVTPVPGDQPIPIVDFFRPPILQQPSISPDGSHIAAIVTAESDRHDLLIYDVAAQAADRLTAPVDRDIQSFAWLDSRRLVFQLSARKLYGVGLFAVEVGALRDAYAILQYYGSHLISVPDADPLYPLVWNRHDGLSDVANRDLGVASVHTGIKRGKFIDLYGATATAELLDLTKKNNARNLAKRYPTPPSGIVTRYLADKSGQLAFAETMTDGVSTLYRLAGPEWQKCPVDIDDIHILGPGEKPGELVVIGPSQEGKPRAVQFLDAATGTLGEVLLQDDAYDFYSGGLSPGRLHRDPITHQILGVSFDRAGPSEIWFSESYRALQKIIDAQFPDQIVRVIDSDKPQKTFLVESFSDRQPVIYSWVHLDQRSAGLFKNSAPWIDPKRMQRINGLKFKTRDGRKLDAYLTLPAGASKEHPVPLVVLPHGGPWARDAWHFDGEAQFLASRGYAVLKPNYRGSTGYNWAFPSDDKYDFAKMHDDVTDATRTVIKTGLIDPHRIAIMGASFGGYLAIAGVVNEPDLYRCAVSIAGVFDWADMIRDKKFDQYDSPVFGYLLRKLGDPKLHPERFAAISPGRRVDRIRVPVFVAGGREDYTVNIAQSKELLSNLDKYNVPHEAYIVVNEGHGMGYVEHDVELYTRIEAFLAKHLAKAP